jgi:hypothetical protein
LEGSAKLLASHHVGRSECFSSSLTFAPEEVSFNAALFGFALLH